MTTRTSSPFGRYPSPVFRADLDAPGCTELFVKNDGVLRDDYGGNKVRKLEGVLPELAARGAGRVLTAGPAGSHHVLATTLLARQLGLRTAAVLFPQPHSLHAVETLRTALALGLEPIPTKSKALVPLALIRSRRPGDALVLPGASSPAGATGYADAIKELKGQIEAGVIPAPHLIVTAVGSGGTAAGLLAGLVHHGLPARLLAVDVGAAGRWAGPLIVGLASRVLRRLGSRGGLGELSARSFVHFGYQAGGYGKPLPDYAATAAVGRALGLEMDPTYTGKALAAAFGLARSPELAARYLGKGTELSFPLRVLYWHTLSKALPAAPRAVPLPSDLSQLFDGESLAL